MPVISFIKNIDLESILPNFFLSKTNTFFLLAISLPYFVNLGTLSFNSQNRKKEEKQICVRLTPVSNMWQDFIENKKTLSVNELIQPI
jgi:hypothetical protein